MIETGRGKCSAVFTTGSQTLNCSAVCEAEEEKQEGGVYQRVSSAIDGSVVFARGADRSAGSLSHRSAHFEARTSHALHKITALFELRSLVDGMTSMPSGRIKYHCDEDGRVLKMYTYHLLEFSAC